MKPKHSWVKRICSNKGPRFFKRGNNNEKVKIHQWFKKNLLMLWHSHCFAQMCFLIETVFKVSDVAHGHLV